MPNNTNFQTFHQMGRAINDVVRQASGRDPVQNIDMDYVTVAQNKTLGELTYSGNPVSFVNPRHVQIQRILLGMKPMQDLHGQVNPYPAGGGNNIWDEQWELGTLNSSTGEKVGSVSMIRSKNYILVNAETSYYFCIPPVAEGKYVIVCYYDSSYDFISSEFSQFRTSRVITTPQDCAYILFRMPDSYGTTYNNDIAINYPSTVTNYSPYSNICPITGWTGVQASRTGRNLIPSGTDTQNGYQNNQYIKASDGAGASSSSYYSSEYFIVSPDTVYTLYDSNETVAGQPSIVFYDRDKNFISGSGVRIDNVAVHQITTPSNAVYARCSQRKESAGSLIQFEIGSHASTAEEYTGDVYPVTFPDPPGTVYDGTLDLITGVLTVDMAGVDLGSLSYTAITSGGVTAFRNNIGAKSVSDNNQHGLTSIYPFAGTRFIGNMPDKTWMIDSSGRLNIRDDAYSDTSLFATALSGQTLVYELAEPRVYHLTPQQVTTLIGDNVISTDADTLEVMYYQYGEVI